MQEMSTTFNPHHLVGSKTAILDHFLVGARKSLQQWITRFLSKHTGSCNAWSVQNIFRPARHKRGLID